MTQLLFGLAALFGSAFSNSQELNTLFLSQAHHSIYGHIFASFDARDENQTTTNLTVISPLTNQSAKFTIPLGVKAPLVVFSSGNSVLLMISIFNETGFGEPDTYTVSVYRWPESTLLFQINALTEARIDSFDGSGNPQLLVESGELNFCLSCAGWPEMYVFEERTVKRELLSKYPRVINEYIQKAQSNLTKIEELCSTAPDCKTRGMLPIFRDRISALKALIP